MTDGNRDLKIGLIWAQSANRVIGRDGGMPWHVPEDLKHFKQETLGVPVIMGRKTWESLPERFRPLPGRTNIVLTRDREWREDGVVTAGNLDEALRLGQEALQETAGERSSVDVWVIGGGAIFEEAIGLAQVLSVTQIAIEVDDGDTFAPNITEDWELLRESSVQESSTGLIYRFERYERSRPTS